MDRSNSSEKTKLLVRIILFRLTCIVNLFAHFFDSVYNTNTLEDITPVECDSTRENIVISADELYKVVCELEANTNPGPNGIPAYFVKECWASLQSPILHILNESLRVLSQ